MPSLNWKHYAVLFAAISGMPVFCYWYYSLPHVVDRFSEKWLLEEPQKDNRELHEFMKELSAKRREADHADLLKKLAAEQTRRHDL